MSPVKICQKCHNNPATKRHKAGSFYYCDQCTWELGLRDIVAIDAMGHDIRPKP